MYLLRTVACFAWSDAVQGSLEGRSRVLLDSARTVRTLEVAEGSSFVADLKGTLGTVERVSQTIQSIIDGNAVVEIRYGRHENSG
jgi:hypothetical protein